MATRRTAAKKTEPEPSEVYSIEFRGRTFTVPRNRQKWPTLAMQAFERNQNVNGVELILGPVQWLRLNEVGPLQEDFWEFFRKFRDTVNADFTEDETDKPDKSDDSAES